MSSCRPPIQLIHLCRADLRDPSPQGTLPIAEVLYSVILQRHAACGIQMPNVTHPGAIDHSWHKAQMNCAALSPSTSSKPDTRLAAIDFVSIQQCSEAVHASSSVRFVCYEHHNNFSTPHWCLAERVSSYGVALAQEQTHDCVLSL